MKAWMILLVLLMVPAVAAEYGQETDFIVMMSESEFIPGSMTVKQDEYVKFINLGPEVGIQSSFFKSSPIATHEFVDVRMVESGDTTFFMIDKPHVTVKITVLKYRGTLTGAKIWGRVNYSGGGGAEYNITELLIFAGQKSTGDAVTSRLQSYLERHGLLTELQDQITDDEILQQQTILEQQEVPAVTGGAVIPEAPPVEEVPYIDEVVTQPVAEPGTLAPPLEQPQEVGGEFTELTPKKQGINPWLVIVLILALAGIGFIVYKATRKKPVHHKPRNPQLVNYLKTYKKHGYSEHTLRQHLKTHGHKDEDIDDAMHHSR